ncbi:MAG: hypothetical protein Fur0041_02470 [Bacteroidia bacterium]
MKRIACIFLLSFFVIIQTLNGQNLVASIAKDTISFSETVKVTLTGEFRDINTYATLPEIPGLVIIERSNNFSYSNNSGKIKLSQSFTLQPLKPGAYTIGPAWIQSGNRRFFSNKLELFVKSGGSSQTNNTVFLRCEPDRKKALIGEQITLTIRLYHRVDVRLGSDRPFAKSFSGFWYQQGPLDEAYKDTVVTIKGLKYVGETIYKEYVFPNTAGKLVIPSYEYSCYVRQNPMPTGDPFIDDMMAIDMPVMLNSDPVLIESSALPDENKPSNFSGDVGEFSLNAILENNEIHANEPFRIAVSIRGKGNIHFLQAPYFKTPDQFVLSPLTNTDSIVNKKGSVSGEKTFYFTLTPVKEGKFKIPGFEYSYYDIVQKKYITLSTPEFEINVLPGSGEQDVSENNLPDMFPGEQSYGNVLKIVWIVLPLITALTVLLLLNRRKNKKIKNNTSVENTVVAPPAETSPAPDNLATARYLFNSGNTAEALKYIQEEFYSGLKQKFGIERVDASAQNIRYVLSLKQINPERIESIIKLSEEIALARFRPEAVQNDQFSAFMDRINKI